jgi:peptide/nickel transport system substrate-binding protein
MLKDVGITLKIEVLERQAWVSNTLAYNYEMGILRATLPRPDPDMDFGTYYGRNAKQDYSGIHNPKLWDLVDEGRTEVDQAKRRQTYIEAQKLILDNYWQTYLFWRPTKEVARKELQGFAREFSGAWQYGEMWLSA